MIDYATPKDRDFDINQLEGIIEEEKPEVNTAVPKFDPKWLPPVLRDMAEEVAQSYRVPLDLPACVGLGVASSCACGRVSVKIHDDWTERAQLFIGVCLPSGSKKSPVFDKMTKAMTEWQTSENKKRKIQIEIDKEELLHYENQRQKARKAGKVEAAKEWAEKIAKFNPTRIVERFIGSDTTPESVPDIMLKNGNAVSIIDDEGTIFGILAGRFCDEANLSPFLQGYSGSTIRVHRKGKEPVEIDHGCMSMLLTTQPETMDSVVNDGRMTQQGFAARFLLSFPQERVRLICDPPKVSAKTEAAYNAKLAEMLNLEKRTFVLSPEANRIMYEYIIEYEGYIIDTDRYEAMDKKHFSGKVNGNVNRLAAMLKLWDNTTTDEIGAETMRNAIAIQEYFNAHFMWRYGEIGRLSKYEKNLLNQIAACELPVSEYDLRRIASEFRRKKAPPFEEAIARLCELGYIKRYKAEKSKSILIDLLVKVNP